MKILPVGTELFLAEFRDNLTEIMKLTVTFHNSVNIPKTGAAGLRACGWLRNSAAKRKFAGLTTDDVTGILIVLKFPA